METAQEDRAGLAPDAELMTSGKITIEPVEHVEQPRSRVERVGYLPYGKAGAVVEDKAEISRKPSIFGVKWQRWSATREEIAARPTVPILEHFLPNGTARM